MEQAKEERTSGDMESEEDAELTLGTNTGSGTESPSRSGSIDHDSPRMIGKEEAAGGEWRSFLGGKWCLVAVYRRNYRMRALAALAG